MAGLGDLQYCPQVPSGDEPTYRMSMFPFGTYANPDGTEHLGFALPGMIHEPLMAAQRLFGTPSQPGTFGQGPDAPGNADDMRTLLLSMYGGNAMNPGRMLEGAAAPAVAEHLAELPAATRMYHGTAAWDDFNKMRPSESGSMGPGVYFSTDPKMASTYARTEDRSRVFPVDITGPFASIEHYFDTVHAHDRDYGAAQRALEDQGYTGVMDTGPYSDNIANIFKPGSVRSATTGETLFSDQMPSLFGGLSQQNNDLPTYADGGTVADMPALPALPDYGFGPMTQTTIAGYPNGFISSREPDQTLSQRALSLAELPARATVDQFNTATSGVADALANPSLANVTNAGVQTGLAIGSPTLATISGLGGMGIAAARDLGLGGLSTPAAAGNDIASMVKGDPQLELLYQTYQDELAKSTANVPGRNRTESAAIRAAAGERAAAAMQAINSALAQRQAAALSQKNADHQALLDKQKADYDNAVNVATNARDMELGRDRRFSDTDVGKVYDKLGGYAPLVAGFVPGVVSRLAYGPAASLGSKALRAFTGAGFGVGANNVPLVYNAFSTEVDNPEQRAYNAYAYNLPDGHPDKAKAQAMADSLPKLNPLRQEAQDELYDPMKFGERAFMGALEGFGGNELGQMAPGGLGGLFRRSSYQLPPSTALASTEAAPLAQQAAASKLLAGNDTILDRTSGPVGPVSEQSLPALAAPADIAPATAKKPAAVRRNKSAGSKGPAKPEKLLPAPASDPSPSPDTQSAAAEEVKRFLGKGPEPMFAAGGSVDGSTQRGKTFAGPLHAASGGRTDVLPIDVAAGSYVLPADTVSALGEGNTAHGVKVLERMFPPQKPNLRYSAGGKVPIVAAAGEHVLSPEQVAVVGGGDLNRGHAILDSFVKHTRNDTINTLKSLPGPAQ